MKEYPAGMNRSSPAPGSPPSFRLDLKTSIHNPGLLSREALRRSFVARTRLFEYLMDVIRTQTATQVGQNHLLLIGPRGMGKTTLLLRLSHAIDEDKELSQRWQTITFPEENYNIRRLSDLWLSALERLGEARGEKGQALMARDLRKRWLKDPKRLEVEALSALHHQSRSLDRGLVLVLDNIQQIFDQVHDDLSLNSLRSLLMLQPWLLVVASSPAYFKEIELPDEPFYGFFRTTQLEGLSLEELRQLLLSWADQDQNLELKNRILASSERLASFKILTGGNPRIAAMLYRLLQDSPIQDTFKDLEQLVDQVTPYYKARTEELARDERHIFDALARRWDPATSREIAEMLGEDVNIVSAHLSRFVKNGLVERVGESRHPRYQIVERFYNLYYLIRYTPNELERLRNFVHFLKLIYNEADLLKLGNRLATRLWSDWHNNVGEDRALDLARFSMMADAVVNPAAKRQLYGQALQLARHSGIDPDRLFTAVDLDGARATLGEVTVTATLEGMKLAREYRNTPGNMELAHKLAINYLSFNQPAEAIPLLELTVGNVPENQTARVSLIFAHFQKGDFKNALKAADEALLHAPDSAIMLNLKGVDLLALGQLRAAMPLLQKAVELEPKNAAFHNNLGQCLTGIPERQAEGIAELKVAIELEPKVVQARWNLTETLLLQRHFEESLEQAKGLTELAPDLLELHFVKAHLLEQTRHAKTAQKARKEGIRHLTAQTPFGILLNNLLHLGLFQEAEAVVGQQKRLLPTLGSAWRYNLGLVRLKQHRENDAELLFQESAVALKDCSEALQCSARLTTLGFPKMALIYADRARDLDARSFVAHIQRSHLLNLLLRFEEAEHAAMSAIETDAFRWVGWNNLGAAQQRLGRLDEAHANFQKASDLAPGELLPLANMIRALAQLERRDELADLMKAIIRGSENREFVHQLAQQLYLSNTIDCLEALAREALKRFPLDLQFHTWLAMILLNKADPTFLIDIPSPDGGEPLQFIASIPLYLLELAQCKDTDILAAALILAAQNNEVHGAFTLLAAILAILGDFTELCGAVKDLVNGHLDEHARTTLPIKILVGFLETFSNHSTQHLLERIQQWSGEDPIIASSALSLAVNLEADWRAVAAARQMVEEAEQTWPIPLAIMWLKAALDERDGRWLEAANRWRAILTEIEASPDQPLPPMLSANLLSAEEFSTATIQVRLMENLYRDDASEEEMTEILEICDKLKNEPSKVNEATMFRFRALVALQRISGAKNIVESLLTASDLHVPTATEIASIETGDLDLGALQETLLNRLRKLDPNNAMVLEALGGKILFQSTSRPERLPESVVALERSIELDPDRLWSRLFLVEAYIDQSSFPEAIAALADLLSKSDLIDPEPSDQQNIFLLCGAIIRQGYSVEIARILDQTGYSERWEPLRVALAILSGEDPRRDQKVAREIGEAARELVLRYSIGENGKSRAISLQSAAPA